RRRARAVHRAVVRVPTQRPARPRALRGAGVAHPAVAGRAARVVGRPRRLPPGRARHPGHRREHRLRRAHRPGHAGPRRRRRARRDLDRRPRHPGARLPRERAHRALPALRPAPSAHRRLRHQRRVRRRALRHGARGAARHRGAHRRQDRGHRARRLERRRHRPAHRPAHAGAGAGCRAPRARGVLVPRAQRRYRTRHRRLPRGGRPRAGAHRARRIALGHALSATPPLLSPPPQEPHMTLDTSAPAALPAAEELRSRLTGALHLPGEPGFLPAALPWNVSVLARPIAVVTAAHADDVQTAVAHAAQHGIRVTVLGPGHGASPTLEGTLLIRAAGLDRLEIAADARTAIVGAGVSWGTLQAALDATGLTGLVGSSPSVSVVGLLLQGGYSWLSRAFGAAAGSLRAAEVVTVDGARGWIDESTDAELLWA